MTSPVTSFPAQKIDHSSAIGVDYKYYIATRISKNYIRFGNIYERV